MVADFLIRYVIRLGATQHGRSSKYKNTKDMVRVPWTEDGGFFKLPTMFSSMAV